MLNLAVQKRDTKQTKAKRLLEEGYVPAVLYGPKTVSRPVSVDRRKFNSVYKKAGETRLISLKFEEEEKDGESDNKSKNVVLIRDVQSHPVTGKISHVDFYELPMDQPIEITIPVIQEGESPAVKEQGALLTNNLYEIVIKALPKDLIQEVIVDISSLEEFGDSILVKDLSVPNEVEIMHDPEEVVFSVEEPEEEPEEEEEEVTEDEEEQIADIKTEGEEKREEAEQEAAEEEEVQSQE